MLLAEDEDELRNFIARTLKSQGYQVLTAQNGREALQLVANNQAQIDILVTDIVMPEVGGRELAVQLRKSQRTVPIVFISGYTNDPESFRENPPNLEYFLAKPFGSVDLAKKLRQALQDSLAARTTPPG